MYAALSMVLAGVFLSRSIRVGLGSYNCRVEQDFALGIVMSLANNKPLGISSS
jgi:hypothetical protein